MAESKKPAPFKLSHVLVEYEGPQLIELRKRKTYFVAVACPEGEKYFGCQIKVHSYRKYLEGRADLDYVFKTAAGRRYYYFSEIDDDTFTSTKADPDEAEVLGHWPGEGVFSYIHTSDHTLEELPNGEQTFSIDGRWDVRDFGKLNNQLSDLYSTISVIADRNDPNVSESVSDALAAREFRGGGSYSGLYKDIKQAANDNFRMKAVQYASPGYIKVSGDIETLRKLRGVILSLEHESAGEMRRKHRDLEKLLKDNNLLSSSSSKGFGDKKLEVLAKAWADDLYKFLGFEGIDWVHQSSSASSLVYVKFVRSLFRRVLGIHDFVFEGRITEISEASDL